MSISELLTLILAIPATVLSTVQIVQMIKASKVDKNKSRLPNPTTENRKELE